MIETWVDRLLHRIYRRKTPEQLEAEEVKRHELVVAQTTKCIQDQKYLRHMALVNIEGHAAWKRGEILTESSKPSSRI